MENSNVHLHPIKICPACRKHFRTPRSSMVRDMQKDQPEDIAKRNEKKKNSGTIARVTRQIHFSRQKEAFPGWAESPWGTEARRPQ